MRHQKLDESAPMVRQKIGVAFRALRKSGYIARQNFMCCMGCGFAAMPEGTKKAVFYHRQDADRLSSSGRCYIAWGGDGQEIRKAFEAAGLKVEWDGTEAARFCVSEPAVEEVAA